MENNNEASNEKKFMNKAKSCNSGPSAGLRSKNDAMKRKSLYINDAVRSLDLALGRLKKSKLSNAGHSPNTQITSNKMQGMVGMFKDPPSFAFNQGIDNASVMSMNFSHYELMRNLSQSNCNSDGAVSGTTGDRHASPADLSMKDEHLEKYFRSIEMWRRNYNMDGPSNLHLEIPEN